MEAIEVGKLFVLILYGESLIGHLTSPHFSLAEYIHD